jgi:S-formylglutathione hydrolase FrmB
VQHGQLLSEGLNTNQYHPELFFPQIAFVCPGVTSQATPAFAAAATEGIALVIPDTSPRGAGVEGEDASWDFGTGAGFYVDATKAPWSTNYNM